MRELTTAAQAAKLIRSELKQAFPEIKFRVRSRNYAGGHSVDVAWTNGPVTESVKEITGKYQQGHFDGMTDSYVYSNGIEGLPQVNFVFAKREITPEAYEAKKTAIAKEFGIADPADDSAWFKVFSRWPQEVVYRELRDQVLEGVQA